MFTFEFSEKRKLIKDMAAKFAQKEILPVRDQFEADYEKGELVDHILLEAAKIGLLGFPIQEKYGGSDGNNIDTMVVLEELAAVDGGNLWGLDIFQTTDALKKSHGGAKASVISIGPSGENRVVFFLCHH